MQGNYDWRRDAELLTIEVGAALEHLHAGAYGPAVGSLAGAAGISSGPEKGQVQINTAFEDKARSLAAAAKVTGQWVAAGKYQVAINILESTLRENATEISSTATLFGRKT